MDNRDHSSVSHPPGGGRHRKTAAVLPLAAALILAFLIAAAYAVAGRRLSPRLQVTPPLEQPEAEASPLERRPESTPPAIPDYAELEKAVKQTIQGKTGTWGVYVEDLNTGLRFGINPDLEFVAASTIKVPLVLFLYRQAQDGKLDLNETLAIKPEDYESGTGRLQSRPVGSRYTLRELARLALVDSDNVATRMLLRRLGRESFQAYVHELGAFISPDRENVTSPRDMAAFFKAVLAFKKEAPALGGELLDALQHTNFNDRIPALLPPDTPVAHKIGNQVRVVNDAGLVLLTRHPYLISLFTDDVNEGEATATLAQISKLVYDYQAGLR